MAFLGEWTVPQLFGVAELVWCDQNLAGCMHELWKGEKKKIFLGSAPTQMSLLHFRADLYLFKAIAFINAYKPTAIRMQKMHC